MTISAEIKARVAELHATGRTMRDIGTELKIGKSSVAYILKQQAPAPEPVVELSIDEESVPIEEGVSMSISEIETSSFLKSIEPPAPVLTPAQTMDQKDFIRKLAMSIKRKPEPVQEEEEQDEEPEAPKRPIKTPKIKDVPAPVKVPEMDKGTLIAKISSLVLTFAPILSAHVKDPARFIEQLPGKSLADLKTTLELLEATKSIHNGASGMFHMFGMVAGAVELGGSKLHLQTAGYQAAIMSQSDELKRIFQEIAYNNVDSIKRLQSPEARLALLMTQTLLAIDSRNRVIGSGQGNGTGGTGSGTGVPPETQEKFNDL